MCFLQMAGVVMPALERYDGHVQRVGVGHLTGTHDGPQPCRLTVSAVARSVLMMFSAVCPDSSFHQASEARQPGGLGPGWICL
jgi:hypothetical protein